MNVDELFDDIKGAFAAGRNAQAYVVAGPVRGAAGMLVEQVLSYLFCTAEDKPCASCRGCLTAFSHTHEDLMWVEPQKKSRVISVDQVRELQARMLQTSFSGGWKACVMAGADRLGDQAANAFLKLLEEPPAMTVFFLVTDSPQFLLPTIISRCQRVTVESNLEDLPVEWRSGLEEILSGDGNKGVTLSVGRSERLLSLLKEVKKRAKEEVEDQASYETLEESDETLDARINARYREYRREIIAFILRWYRDILVIQCGSGDEFVYNTLHLEYLKERGRSLSYRKAANNVSIIENLNRRIERNIPEGALFDYTFSRIS